MREKTVVQTASAFLKAHAGKDCLAVFTGYSWRAFCAYLWLLEAHCTVDSHNDRHLISAMTSVLATLQERELPLAHLAIAAVKDWNDRDPLWFQIGPNWNFVKIEPQRI